MSGAGAQMVLRQRSGAPPPTIPPRALATAAVLNGDEDSAPMDDGWVRTWTWTLCWTTIYFLGKWAAERLIPGDPNAYAELSQQVPPLVYQMSSCAFFTAFVLNLTSLLFEDNAPKRQLALLSCAIKAAACHTDLLLITGGTTVVVDAFGTIVVPQRYAQWLVTTPTMIYILSKISDFTPLQTSAAIATDVLMVLTGLWANFLPTPYSWLMFGLSSLLFVGVLYSMGRMVYSAVLEHPSASSRRSLCQTPSSAGAQRKSNTATPVRGTKGNITGYANHTLGLDSGQRGATPHEGPAWRYVSSGMLRAG
ncbi:hypothetical protein TSOC_006854 [Tetrabaena socialis]|uniref:Transmembrane protein n=1 Tax=Tetrabaena socialis TaxID=47790 RepID=A0A2J8A2M5_9CHLO|nr:hypothetical protein TSOC_006854 [Tetrabaena socialis]|eukprot:PNH06772.1 hypothetical protein TSOC_006854 [Tetrabaena socialis]